MSKQIASYFHLASGFKSSRTENIKHNGIISEIEKKKKERKKIIKQFLKIPQEYMTCYYGLRECNLSTMVFTHLNQEHRFVLC